MPSPTTGMFDFALRYQRVRGAQYHVRPVSLLQQEILYRCDGRVTTADLADATRHTHPEIRAVLSFLLAHGLVKTLIPEPWLFQRAFPASSRQQSTPATRRRRRFLDKLKHLRV